MLILALIGGKLNHKKLHVGYLTARIEYFAKKDIHNNDAGQRYLSKIANIHNADCEQNTITSSRFFIHHILLNAP